MEVSVQVDKIIKLKIILLFFTSGGGVNVVVNNWTNYQRCQFDVHFIWCQTSADIHLGNCERVY